MYAHVDQVRPCLDSRCVGKAHSQLLSCGVVNSSLHFLRRWVIPGGFFLREYVRVLRYIFLFIMSLLHSHARQSFNDFAVVVSRDYWEDEATFLFAVLVCGDVCAKRTWNSGLKNSLLRELGLEHKHMTRRKSNWNNNFVFHAQHNPIRTHPYPN